MPKRWHTQLIWVYARSNKKLRDSHSNRRIKIPLCTYSRTKDTLEFTRSHLHLYHAEYKNIYTTAWILDPYPRIHASFLANYYLQKKTARFGISWLCEWDDLSTGPVYMPAETRESIEFWMQSMFASVTPNCNSDHYSLWRYILSWETERGEGSIHGRASLSLLFNRLFLCFSFSSSFLAPRKTWQCSWITFLFGSAPWLGKWACTHRLRFVSLGRPFSVSC